MATFISNKGEWHPAKESVGLIYVGDKTHKKEDLPDSITISKDVLTKGDPFIYNGPDRDALKILEQDGQVVKVEGKEIKVLGSDFRKDPEFLQAIRNQGFNSVKDYLKNLGYDEEADTKKFEEKAESVLAHEVPKRNKEIRIMGGGKNTADGSADTDIIGGFGEERMRPASEVK